LEIGRTFWAQIEAEARKHIHYLSEQLKSVLQANQLASFKGDYKHGKRLNMKKIISYIASNFRKDKIWLRRQQPSKRSYQIIIAIDNSFSMQEQGVGLLAM